MLQSSTEITPGSTCNFCVLTSLIIIMHSLSLLFPALLVVVTAIESACQLEVGACGARMCSAGKPLLNDLIRRYVTHTRKNSGKSTLFADLGVPTQTLT